MELGIQTEVVPAKNVVVINRRIEDKLKTKTVKRRVLREIPYAKPDIKQLWRIYKTYDEPYLFRGVGEPDALLEDLQKVFGDNLSDMEKVLRSFQPGKGTASTGVPQPQGVGAGERLRGVRRPAGSQVGQGYEIGWARDADFEEFDNAMRRRRPAVGSREMSALNAGNILGEGMVASIGGRNLRETQARRGRMFADLNLNAALGTLLQRTGIRGQPRPASDLFPSTPRASSTGVSGISTGLSGAATRAASGAATPARQYSKYGVSEGMRSGGRMSNISFTAPPAAPTQRPSMAQVEVLSGRAPKYGVSEGARSGGRRK